MPRPKWPNGDGTVRPRQLADGTTVYDVLWSYRDPRGAPRRGVKKGFRTERDATVFRRRTTSAVDSGTYIKPSTITLAQWLVLWLSAARLAPQTLAGYERDAYRRITPSIGHIKLADLRASHLNTLYRTLETSGCSGGRGPLAPSTVRNVHSTLCSALTATVNDELIANSPARKATPPTPRQVRATRPAMQTWSAAQVRKFLGATSGDRLGPLWHLLLTTGMRRGEALALRWADVDLDNGYIAVQRSLGEDRRKDEDGKRNELVFGPTKSGKAHTIAMDTTTVAVMRNTLRCRQPSGCSWAPAGRTATSCSAVARTGSKPPMTPEHRCTQTGRRNPSGAL